MTDPELNQAIHDHLGLPRTVTRWRFRFQNKHESVARWWDTDHESDARNAYRALVEYSGGTATEPEPFESPLPVKDYCNDRDATAEALGVLLQPQWSQFLNAVVKSSTMEREWYSAGLVVAIMRRPCRDLAVAFCKTIHPDKITP